MKSYGINNQQESSNSIDLHLENINLKGFSIEKSLISNDKCDIYIKLLEEIYTKQENEFSKEHLEKINELDMVRMPFIDNPQFFDLFLHPLVEEITTKVLGNVYNLHLQNAIMNRPNKEHHQTSWHRDLPYQNWVISKPIAFNAFFCLTDFTEENGATVVLPYSHRSDNFPSKQFVDNNQIQLTASKGSVIFFDSMLFHRASYNSSDFTRVGVNNMFVVPILKQQINIPQNIDIATLNEKTKNILGYNFEIPTTVNDFRLKRLGKCQIK